MAALAVKRARAAARRFAWGGAGLAAAALSGLLARAPVPAQPRFPCPVRAVVGLPCPGCGMTRAVLHLLHGEWAAAWGLHPLAPFMLLQAIGLWLVWGLVAAGRRGWPTRRVVNVWLTANAAALLAVWLLRLLRGTLPW